MKTGEVVVYLHDHLLSAQKRIANELARPQCHGLLPIRHDCKLKEK